MAREQSAYKLEHLDFSVVVPGSRDLRKVVNLKIREVAVAG